MASPHATAAKKGGEACRVDGGGKSKREDGKTKKTACGKAGAHRPNHINTDWRKDGGRTDGRREGAECCKTNPYWKSSLVLRAERSAWSQRACVCVCVLNRLRPLESPRSAK